MLVPMIFRPAKLKRFENYQEFVRENYSSNNVNGVN